MSSARENDEPSPRLSPAAIHAAIAAAVALYLWRAIGPFTAFPGTRGDARFNQVVLEHLWLWATGRADSLDDPAFFYPFANILYLSDTHWGSGFVYVASRALGASREVAFDIWFLVGLATTFAATLYVFRRFGAPGVAAAFGACVFTFSLPMLAQDAHAQLVYRFGVPLATLACVECLRAPSPRNFAALSLWVAWQFLCSFYIGVFLLEWLALFGAAAAFAPGLRPRPAPHASGRAGDLVVTVAAALACALAAYMLWRHAGVARGYAIHRDMAEIELTQPRWSSLLAQLRSPTVGWISSGLPHGVAYWEWEHQLFPGLGVILLAATGAVSARGEMRQAAAACLFAIFGLLALTMDVGGFGLFRLYSELPGFNAIRSPARIALVIAFPLAWLASLGVAALLRSGTRAAIGLLSVALLISVADIGAFQSNSVEIADARARIKAMAAGLDAPTLRERGSVLMRYGDDDFQAETLRDIDLMIVAQDLGLRAINGYSGSVPPPYRRPRDCAEARAWIAKVDALPHKRAGADDVAARAMIVPPGACAAQ